MVAGMGMRENSSSSARHGISYGSAARRRKRAKDGVVAWRVAVEQAFAHGGMAWATGMCGVYGVSKPDHTGIVIKPSLGISPLAMAPPSFSPLAASLKRKTAWHGTLSFFVTWHQLLLILNPGIK